MTSQLGRHCDVDLALHSNDRYGTLSSLDIANPSFIVPSSESNRQAVRGSRAISRNHCSREMGLPTPTIGYSWPNTCNSCPRRLPSWARAALTRRSSNLRAPRLSSSFVAPAGASTELTCSCPNAGLDPELKDATARLVSDVHGSDDRARHRRGYGKPHHLLRCPATRPPTPSRGCRRSPVRDHPLADLWVSEKPGQMRSVPHFDA